LRHFEPDAALLAWLVHGVHARAALLSQRLQELRRDGFAGHEHGRHGHAQVVLGDEGFEHLRLDGVCGLLRRAALPWRSGLRRGFGDICILRGLHGFRRFPQRRGIFDMLGKVGAVAEVAAAAHHGQVHAGAPALHAHGEDVHVLVGRRFHGLLVQHARQSGDLVAQFGGLFEFELVGVREHARFEFLQQLLRLAAQQRLGVLHVLRVGRGRDRAHAGARAALDLVEQAGPRAVGKHRVFTGAQAKHLLQQLDRLFHGPAVRVGAEVAVLFVDGAAVVREARKLLLGRLHRRVRTCRSRLARHARELQKG